MKNKVNGTTATGTTPGREPSKLDLQKKKVEKDAKLAQGKWRPFQDIRYTFYQ